MYKCVDVYINDCEDVRIRRKMCGCIDSPLQIRRLLFSSFFHYITFYTLTLFIYNCLPKAFGDSILDNCLPKAFGGFKMAKIVIFYCSVPVHVK